ncbi:hypothetical protein CEE39_04015 [bacterium (candidate division B38) B3_B38]|nr:MAG: hypothetical protein CEE39_04015 [bacterium (candidate division B38) B3_B38]
MKGNLYIFALLIALSAANIYGQTNIGQYEDEAPLGSWNLWGPYSSRSLGMGQVSLAFPYDSSAGFHNPAALPFVSGSHIVLNLVGNSASLYKYSLVNTGVISIRSPASAAYFSVGYVGGVYQRGRWAFSLNYGELENYLRPSVEYFEGAGLHCRYRGSLDYVNLAVARRLSDRIALGVAVNRVWGERLREIEYSFYTESIRNLSIEKMSQTLSGYYFIAGLLVQLNDKLNLAVAWRSPHKRRAESTFYREFSNRFVFIPSRAESDNDEYKIPSVIGFGAGYRVNSRLTLGMDVALFGWKKYEVTYFGETTPRSFASRTKVNLGAEYLLPIRIGQRKVILPLRLGYYYDPQPPLNPETNYHNLTLGGGLKLWRLNFDAAFTYGFENSSGHGLRRSMVNFSTLFYF